MSPVAFGRETDFDIVDVVVNVRLESPLDSQVGVASLVLDVGVEFLASGGRTALGVSEPPVAAQFLDGLTDRVARVMLGESTVAMLPISPLCVN